MTNPTHPHASAPVGDLTLSARGSAARFNAGKPDYSLVPLRIMGTAMRREVADDAAEALMFLGRFQARRHVDDLYDIFRVLGLDGWEECARVFDYGKHKYVAWNWAKGMPWSVPIACAARHLIAMWRGDEIDVDTLGADGELIPGSGLPHRGHVFCNIVMLITYMDTYPEGNDLAPEGALG